MYKLTANANVIRIKYLLLQRILPVLIGCFFFFSVTSGLIGLYLSFVPANVVINIPSATDRINNTHAGPALLAVSRKCTSGIVITLITSCAIIVNSNDCIPLHFGHAARLLPAKAWYCKKDLIVKQTAARKIYTSSI